MGNFLPLIPLVVIVLTALTRVHAMRGAHLRGAVEREVTLNFAERLRYHRVSLYALAAVLVIGALGGVTHAFVDLLAMAAMYGVLAVPVRVRMTREGIAVNRLFFRPWSEFAGYAADAHRVRLIGRPGFRALDLPLSGDRQPALVARVSTRLRPVDGAATTRSRRLLLGGAAAVVALAMLTYGASAVLADGPNTTPAPQVDAAGTTVGAPEDLAGVTVGGGRLTPEMFTAAQQDEPFAYNLSAYVNQNRIAINLVWTLVAGFLVMFMQAGFAMVETGFSRAKSALHVMMTNFMIYGIGMLAYWVVGFAVQFGGAAGPSSLGGGTAALDKEFTIRLAGHAWGLFGYRGFFLSPGTLDVGIAVLFLFQMVFMDTAATILTGTVAERWTWLSFMIWGVFIGAIIYPVFGNWAWGGGWLFGLKDSVIGRPYVDFAGSGVVHAVGGWAGLAACIVVGPRLGRFRSDGTPVPMPGHNLTMAAVGTFILAFGWFGFNPGSTLGASGNGMLRIGEIATVTMLAGAAASVSAMCYSKMFIGKYDAGFMMNGLLGGLVAITAPSGYVSPILAVIIGGIAGVLCCASIGFWERTMKVDDVVGAVSVHGVCGIWGVLSVGLFADGTAPDFLGLGHPVKGLFFGDPSQLVAQLVGAVTVIVWAFGTSWLLFTVLKRMGIFRSKPEDELAGLDLPEMGGHAYPIQDLGSGGVLSVGGLSTSGAR